MIYKKYINNINIKELKPKTNSFLMKHKTNYKDYIVVRSIAQNI